MPMGIEIFKMKDFSFLYPFSKSWLNESDNNSHLLSNDDTVLLSVEALLSD